MKILSKIWILILVWLFSLLPSFSNARSLFWINDPTPVVTDPTLTDPDGEVKEMKTIAGWTDYETNKLQWILQFPERTDYATPLWYALSLIKVSVNWILGILATVALIYMLYSWFLILSSWADDKNAKKGRKWISTAAIALAWLWLAWIFVSAMIWFITLMTEAD